MGIGSYPAVSLTKARHVHAKAREDLRAEGIDPVRARQELTLEENLREHNALQEIAEERVGRQTKWNESHRSKVALRLTKDVYPIIGARPIAEITPPEVLDCLRRVEARGAVDSALWGVLNMLMEVSAIIDNKGDTAPAVEVMKAAWLKSFPSAM